MPSPFSSKKSEPQATGAKVATIKVTNSVLACEFCFSETSEGEYVPDAKRLTFTCPNGHDNVVRNIEL